ncbi:MAG: hypothetical protein JST48_00055 [Bacteroidetes bacterium]|nr:hypothetical protein [Bacteroidota bacterium]
MKKYSASLLFAFFLFFGLSAQPGGGGGKPCPRPPCPPPVPISGIEVLLGVGAFLGARKLMKASAKKTQ